MTPQEQNGLLVILGDVGQLPTDMNAAHGIVAEKADQIPQSVSPSVTALRATILAQNAIAEAANGKIGGTTGALEKLKAAILAIPTSGQPPVDPPPPPPVGTGFTPPMQHFETRNISGGQPHTVYSIEMGAAGMVSVEISGSPLVTFSAGAKGSFDPARTAVGAGTASPIAIAAGEWCNWKYDAPQGGQNMRPQLLPAR